LGVVIPWADQLQFRHDQTRMRRDHAKYLALIAASALLHQYQRGKKTKTVGGQTIEYIQATQEDAQLANRLAAEVLGQSLDALLPQTRQLLALIDDYVCRQARRQRKARGLIRFTQRQLREQLGWGDFQVRRHLARLVQLEYVLAHRTGNGNQRQYQLLYDGQGRTGEKFLLGLTDASQLRDGPSQV
jgi:DNA primase